MATRVLQWGLGKWKVLSDDFADDLNDAWRQLHVACTDKNVNKPKFAIRHVKNIITWPAKAGLGFDVWLIRLWGALPDEGLRIFLNIIYLALDGAVPMQALLVLIGLMPKDKGGERPIAFTSMLYRVIMKLCKSSISEWDESAAGFWDTAIKGNSCLRAALCRALGMELASARGFASVGFLWDVTSFFDSIRIHRLGKLPLGRGFPPLVLRLAMKVHMAARAFKDGPYVSHFIKPTGTSILAGCCPLRSLRRHAQGLQALPDPVLRGRSPSDAHWRRRSGLPPSHRASLGPCSQAARRRFSDLKSSVVASSPKYGLVLAVADYGRDLYVDFTAGARRRVILQKNRMARVRSGTKVVLKMSNNLKEARKLQLTAVRPRAWGFAAQGCAPSSAKALRSNIGRGLNIKKAGGCLTTAFCMHGYSNNDPWLTYSLDNVLQFMQALVDLPRHQRMAAEQVWEQMKEELEGKYRWARVNCTCELGAA